MRSRTGDIFEIELAHGSKIFSQKLYDPEFAFFEVNPLDITDAKPLFRIWVHVSAIKNWKKIGQKLPSGSLAEEVVRYKQDPINGELSLYTNTMETPATPEQVKGLECAAVWENEHIISRLEDHLAGEENIWVKSMEPKLND